MPRIRPKNYSSKYNVRSRVLLAKAKKDHDFNMSLITQKIREESTSFSYFSIQPEYFLGIKQ